MVIETNLIPFSFTNDLLETSLVVGISRRADREIFKPLIKAEMPQSFFDEHRKRLGKLTQLYSDFSLRDDENFRTSINLCEAPSFAMHYARYILRRHFEHIDSSLVSNDFVNNISVWMKATQQKDARFTTYFDFTLKVQHKRMTEGMELVVTYDGVSRVMNQSIASITSINPDHYSKVVYNGRMYRYDDATAPFHNDPSSAFPIVNKDLEADFNLPLTERLTDNKYIRVKKMTAGFCARYLLKKTIGETLQFADSFFCLPDNEVHVLPSSSSNLLFSDWKGNEVIDNDIVRGFKGGPYEKAPNPKLRIFFIYQKNSGEQACDFLLNTLSKGAFPSSFVNGRGDTIEYTKIKPISKAIKHTFHHEDGGDICFSSLETAIEEVKSQLLNKKFDSSFTYLAFYVSPISKDSWDSKYRDVVYAGIKEACLNHCVSVQGFFEQRLNDGESLQYSFTNIYAAILAKIGGKPWIIRTDTPDDLIIGVGAFYSQKKGKRYLGSAFCFDGTGIMHEFSCIHEKDRKDLIAKIKNAVLGFITNNGGVIPNRIIIHFYKELSKDDWAPIYDMLNNLGIKEIPVIVVTLGKTESKDILGYDKLCKDYMPLAGTYFKVDEDAWLLFNNMKSDQASWDKNVSSGRRVTYHFPIKVRFDCRNSSVLEEEATIKDLIQQIFQLSRMYWKSVDQQNLPITIKYPSMLTEFLPYFTAEEIPNPQFGCQSLWFL